MRKRIKKFFEVFGIKIIMKKRLENPHDMEKDFYDIFLRCKPYTMTTTERMYSLYKAVEYIVNNKVEGDIVECGVWRGGSSMMAALSLAKFDSTAREMYLYDTYEGMSVPTEKDVNYLDEIAKKTWKKNQQEDHNAWCYAPLEEVRNNMRITGYPEEKIHFIKGKVEETIPAKVPQKIAVLRLDTDWYESIYHTLKNLYPLLVEGGILIIDDYGYWKGAREATDQYFRENNINILLNRIDGGGRIALKI